MTMRLAMIGLGKMGANMARRLCRKGIEVVGYDRDVATVAGLAAETSMVAAASVADAVSKLTAPRVVWLMLKLPKASRVTSPESALSLPAGVAGPRRSSALIRASSRRGCTGLAT